MSKHDFNNESSVGIYISTFLGTVTLFFVGILISKLDSFDESLKIPILFLIVATFGFIFSSVVYANLTGSSRKTDKYIEKHIHAGNSMSEYLGLYPFVASIPLVINSITEDPFLNMSILVVSTAALTVYSVSDLSLLRREFTKQTSLLLSTLIGTFTVVMYSYQKNDIEVFQALGAVFLFLMLLLSITTYRKSNKAK